MEPGPLLGMVELLRSHFTLLRVATLAAVLYPPAPWIYKAPLFLLALIAKH